MKLLVLIIGVFAIHSAAYAEVINGPANVRAEINGSLLISVNDRQSVYAHELENEWHRVHVVGFVRAEEMVNDVLSKGAKLYEKNFQTEIGTTLISIAFGDEHPYYEYSDSVLVVMIVGYTHQNNIQFNSVLERQVENISTKNEFYAHDSLIHQFDFYEINLPNYKMYFVYDNNSLFSNPDCRLILYFNNDNQLIAVANHTRKLELISFGESKIDKFYRLQYVMDLTNTERQKFELQANEYFYGIN